jgi:hypothetical protein
MASLITLLVGMYFLIGFTAYGIFDSTCFMLGLMDREFEGFKDDKEQYKAYIIVGVLWPVTIKGTIKNFKYVTNVWNFNHQD